MIGAQNKRLGVAGHDVQPMKEAGIRVVGLVFMDVVLQRRDVTTIAIAEDLAAIGEGSVGKFPHRCLLDIGRYPHFQKAGIALLIQGQRYENLRFFCAPPPLFPCCWATKVRIINFDDSAQLMSFIPLAHGNADAFEHESGSFVGRAKHCRQLNGGNAPLVLTHKIERQKPLRQRHMGLVQYCPRRHRDLMAALDTLISPVGQPVSVTAATFGANISGLPAQRCQMLLAPFSRDRVTLRGCPVHCFHPLISRSGSERGSTQKIPYVRVSYQKATLTRFVLTMFRNYVYRPPPGGGTPSSPNDGGNRTI